MRPGSLRLVTYAWRHAKRLRPVLNEASPRSGYGEDRHAVAYPAQRLFARPRDDAARREQARGFRLFDDGPRRKDAIVRRELLYARSDVHRLPEIVLAIVR